MRRMMMILTVLSAILLNAIMTGCKTLKIDAPALPPKPERSRIETPHSVKDYAEVIAYYERLVQEWELWGDTVESVIGESSEK